MDGKPLGAHAGIAQAEAEAKAGGLGGDVQTGAAALGGDHSQEGLQSEISFKKSP